MAGGKETPRQRMIGILYLVLLGLVALNVPDNLLDAFKNISDSLSSSKSNVQTGIDNTFDAFEKTKLKEQPDRAKPIYDKAKQASAVANELAQYVEAIKTELAEKAGGIDENINDYKKRDNLDLSAQIMINGKKGEELRKKIDETRNKLMSLLTDKEKVGVNLSLSTVAPKPKKGKPQLSWEEAYFGDGIPMGAAMTSLIKVQSDVKNAESEVVKKILGEVDQAVVNLDKFAAVAVAPSSYIIAGQPYKAEVFLTASDSKSSPDVSVNGSKLQVVDGRGQYTTGTSGEGVRTWVGTIRVRQNDGTIKEYKTPEQKYQVAKPSAVVAAEKMNVLYIGVPNPLAVSAPGIPKDKLKISMSGGSISGSGGSFVARVSSPGKVNITVSGEASPGKTQVLGSTEFRVKRIPDPVVMFAGVSGGATSTANLKGQDRVFAKLENFDFDASFAIKRFNLVILKPRQDAIVIPGTGGNSLNGQMHAAMGTIVPGTKVIFTNVVADGPGNDTRVLKDIIISAN
ncbi:gliding motility protein GldM [Mucilaginibacter daejeonensis]|uniref:type IX secretion system motor protein PorM/GldM n=1 Tax=Mucilaginibacter daejeonensis TaxID=398049 RepID=UPI001D170088|nr:gliding motility protein GldM [Mucilaginibacter daejeonensis]UEG54304.1 gliding motility protein GldM [Mucilaginibacter daejeonensis]